MGNDEYEVKVTRQALEQMRSIVHYISHDLVAPGAADHLLSDLKEAIMKLAFLPKSHSLIEEEPWRSECFRKIIVKNFFIYYWVDDKNSRVQIIAVIYSRRDQIKQLAEVDIQ